MDAAGALDSFLGRLTTVLVEEAQLLGRVRGDVEFIKDEMECMNSLILQLSEAQFRDHLVRAWMKQVVGLTRDCEGNVELYADYVGSRHGGDGILGYLRRILRFLRTIPVRHRIATRIQELKIRARDVGDRRQRYGVTVPASIRDDLNAGLDVNPPWGWDLGELRRWAVLLDVAELPIELVVTTGSDTLIECLTLEPATTTQDGEAPTQVRVFCILGYRLAERVAERLYYQQQHSSVAILFHCMVLHYYNYGEDVGTVLGKILEQVSGQEEDEVTNQAHAGTSTVDEDMEKRLISRIQGHLKGKRFLIVVTTHSIDDREWKRILDALLQAADGCLPGSAIIMSTSNFGLALSCTPSKIVDARTIFPRMVLDFYNKIGLKYKVQSVFELCARNPNMFATKTFLHLVYVNHKRTADELEKFVSDISDCIRLNRSIPRKVLMWCYNELPTKYRSCLLYLTIFPQGQVIRTTCLARRLTAEGLITAATTSAATDDIQSSTDEAKRYLDVLFVRGFVTPREISAAGNIKSFIVRQEVQEFIAKVARDVNFVNTDKPSNLAHRLSIHNRLGWPKSTADGDRKDDIADYLLSLAASRQWQLLKVLDLEGCKGLKKKHMKGICKILLLKYLSLRNTDVTELPKQIKELQCLETLDIRQTKVQMLSKKPIVLPLLKNFLAGHKISDRNGTRTSGESVSAVELPLGIDKMKYMEILSRVKVTDSDSELTGIAQLLKLRKLGVVLHGKSAKLSDLFCQIEKLSSCLRALSICIDPVAAGTQDALASLPQFIERLNISGLRNGISSLVQEHHPLTKITLSGTNFEDKDLRRLGRLGGLCCLRLQHNSYPGNELAFKKDEFKSLKYLLVKGSSIAKISFVKHAAPMLERIVLCFDKMDCLSGIGDHHLHLKEVEFNGDRILLSEFWRWRTAAAAAAPTSSSSAP